MCFNLPVGSEGGAAGDRTGPTARAAAHPHPGAREGDAGVRGAAQHEEAGAGRSSLSEGMLTYLHQANRRFTTTKNSLLNII